MPGPDVAPKGQSQTTEQQEINLLEHFFFGDPSGGYGPVGFINSVQVLVVPAWNNAVDGVDASSSSEPDAASAPVVDRLAEARQKGTGEDHARRRLGEVFGAFRQRAREEGPAVVAGRRGAAGHAPN